MFGNSGSLPAKDQLPLGQFRNRSGTNEMGRVLPSAYGTNRIGCTFISEFFDISSQEETAGKDGTNEGANYYASFAVAVGHGPMLSMTSLYLNSSPVWTDGVKVFIVKLACASNIATCQTANPHGLTNGETIFMFFAFQPFFNGQFVITVISPSQFQYTIPGSAVPDQTATAQNGQNIFFQVQLPPVEANGADSTQITIPNFGTATIYWGTLTQPADPYMANVSGITHPPYKGICYIVFRQLFLGFNQTNAQNVEVVMTRAPEFAWQSNPGHALINATYGDCNPGTIIADLLLNPRAGLGLLPAVDVNTALLDAAIEQFYGYGFGLSPIWTRPDEMRSLFVSILENVDGSPALDANGLLGIILATRPESSVENNALVYECPIITDADLTDLPVFKPGDWSSVVNQTFLTFIDQDSGWVKDFVVWHDNAGVYGKGRNEPQTLDRPMVTHQDLAIVLCGIFGQIAAMPKCTGKLQIAWDDDLYEQLTPGSAFQFQSNLRPQYNDIYRVTAITLPDPAKPIIEIECQIDRTYLYQNAETSLVDDSEQDA